MGNVNVFDKKNLELLEFLAKTVNSSTISSYSLKFTRALSFHHVETHAKFSLKIHSRNMIRVGFRLVL